MPNLNQYKGELYELAPIYNVLLDQYMSPDTTDEERESLEEQLLQVAPSFEDCSVNIIMELKNIKSQLERWRNEQQRVKAVADGVESKWINLKDYLKKAIKMAGLPTLKLDYGIHKAWVQRNGQPSSNISSLNQLLSQEEIKKMPKEILEHMPARYEISYEKAKKFWEDDKKRAKLPSVITFEKGDHLRYS